MPFSQTRSSLRRSLAERGYTQPTPVQAAVLQADADGRDLIVSAQTGSGKTVAYGLAFAPTLLGDAERFGPAGAPLALIIAPTRELALQVERELIWLYESAGARVISCVGGMDARREARALDEGCHIVVGTPGRLRDHLERRRLDMAQLKVVVLDEADEMLNLGFREDLTFLLDATPPQRRTLLFSATIPRDIASLAKRYQHDAVRIDTVDKSQPHGDIEYRAIRIGTHEVEAAVVNVLRFFEARSAMVFCHTREAVRRLHGKLLERGFSAVALSGELSQNERGHALKSLREGRAQVCVATDVAARGIDLPDLGLVIHADLPGDPETLLHRSGRTGRAGRKGLCVLLVPHSRRKRAEALLSQAGVQASWTAPPSAEEIRARDSERLVQDPAFVEEATQEERAAAQALLSSLSPEAIATALVRFHRARLPVPEEEFEPAPQPREKRSVRDGRDGGRRDERARRAFEPSRARSLDERGASEGLVWFQMSVGRKHNADPRWLIPIICRLGSVTKKEIGAIRIFDRETKFVIAEHASGHFEKSVGRGPNDEGIRIVPVQDGNPPAAGKGADKPRAWGKGKPAGSDHRGERKHPKPFKKSGPKKRSARPSERT